MGRSATCDGLPMTGIDIPTHLSGQLLIAMPGLADPNFSGTVTLICEHTDAGAMGLVINHPTNVTLEEIFDQMDVEGSLVQRQQMVLSGGPVNLERGFILHRTGDGNWESSLRINDELTLTASPDIVRALASEEAPNPALMLLGYAGWGPGQLEEEIQQNSWLTTPATARLVLDTPVTERLPMAVAAAGVNFGRLSGGAGRA